MTKPHYLAQLNGRNNPRRIIVFDTESYRNSSDDGKREEHTFRIASAQFMRRPDNGPFFNRQPIAHFLSARDLWNWVDLRCIKSQPTIMVAKNLGYDMRIGDAIIQLADLGWSFDILRLDEEVSWAQARRHRDRSRLLLVDLGSWLPSSLNVVANFLGMQKPPLPPDDDDSLDAWFARCDADVEITARAFLDILGMTSDLCSWRPTGPGHGWALFQTQFLDHKVLVHGDAVARRLERVAAYCGRAEAYQVGNLKPAQYYDMDYKHAYASICRDFCLPAQLQGRARIATVTKALAEPVSFDDETTCLIAATVHVPAAMHWPVLPVRQDGRTLWPTGTFSGVWWLPELQKAIEEGCRLLKIHIAYRYTLQPVMEEWAKWIIRCIDSRDILHLLGKHWSRSVPGRSAMQYSDFREAYDVPNMVDFYAGTLTDTVTGEERKCLQIGEQVYIAEEPRDGQETLPQLLSYIMMQTRLRLLRAMKCAGEANVMYVDTDGLIVNEIGRDRLNRFGDVLTGALRQKGTYGSVRVIAPKAIILADQPRIAGLPKAHTENSDGSFTVEHWEHTRQSFERGRMNSVRVSQLPMRITGRDGRRKVLPDGTTEAYQLELYGF